MNDTHNHPYIVTNAYTNRHGNRYDQVLATPTTPTSYISSTTVKSTLPHLGTGVLSLALLVIATYILAFI